MQVRAVPVMLFSQPRRPGHSSKKASYRGGFGEFVQTSKTFITSSP